MPFEREELERLAQATSSKADYRPTSKLSRDELLGLVAQSAGPRAETHVHEPVAPIREEAEPVPLTPESAPGPGEHRPREALRALTAPDSLRDDQASHGDPIVRPVAPRRGVPVLVSIALVVTAVIAVLFFVL